jgi:cellulose synthase/poly-beta-1,6-N-acetylglucosamine synthase-like glycosyltransferase
MPLNYTVAITGIDWAGLHFASWFEVVFALLMGIPLAFFAMCILYLFRLLFAAAMSRKQVALLERPGAGSETPVTPTGKTQIDARTPIIASSDHRRFAVLIPAHNEELLLGAVLDSLHDLDYPRGYYHLIVIADNCTDRTAAIARDHGAVTLERCNRDLIGKGYALEWALQRLLKPHDVEPDDLREAAGFDAVVILDADTVVSRNMLRAFDDALQAGNHAAQVRYDVLNTAESWRTRLMSCALALAHVVKPLGREYFKLSDGLKGNGMCFSREVVEQVPWSGESITEDIEYTLRLCRAGYRIAFLPQAAVWAQMPTTGAQATSQRKRWEGGRYRLLFTVGPGLLVESWRSRNRLLRDRAFELIIPPFAEMFALPILLMTLCLILGVLAGWRLVMTLALIWSIILAAQAIYLFVGMWVARMPISVSLSLLYAPVYIAWKFGVYALMAVTRSAGGWKRTERHEL